MTEGRLRRAAIVGGGLIGGGWLARLVENGVDVAVYDPDPEAARKLDGLLANAERVYARLSLAPRPAKGGWWLAGSVGEAVAGAELIVEAVPERLDVKQAVYRDIEAAADPAALIASSTSGIMPTDLQQGMRHPGRLLVGHPFNPVYLLPLVELVAGEATAPETIARATAIYERLGMHPLVVRREIEAFVADRLMEALWREALWLVRDDVATAAEVDDALRFGCGLRWAQMGTFQTFGIAGGEQGMRHFLAQFGPCLKWPWTRLMDTPELDAALIDKIADQVTDQADGRSYRELERIRDDNLVAILQALKLNDWGAGRTLAAHERRLFNAAKERVAAPDPSRPILTVERQVPTDWTDYNGHMNESRYLQMFADATDAFMALVGADGDYIAGGHSYFTVETHIRHLDEVRALEPVRVETRLLAADGKRMHLFHVMRHGDGRDLATGEHMLLHVNLETRRSCPPLPEVAARLAEIVAAQAALAVPDGAGRAIGQGRG